MSKIFQNIQLVWNKIPESEAKKKYSNIMGQEWQNQVGFNNSCFRVKMIRMKM